MHCGCFHGSRTAVRLVRNLLTRVRKSGQPFVATLVRSIFAQPSSVEVEEEHTRVVEQLEGRFPGTAEILADAKEDIVAFRLLPLSTGAKSGRPTPEGRLNREIRRRTDVVGIFPDRDAVIRLVGAVLAEQHEQWAVARRYMSAESLAKARLAAGDNEPEEVMPVLAAAG